MKLFLSQLFKTPMFLVFIIIMILFGLPALAMSAEINRYAIVTAIGIDNVEDDSENLFEVSLLTFIPIADQTFKETYKVISAKGRSISEAMDIAGLHVGREVGLSHVRLVVMNQNLLSEDISIYLDYLSRSENIASSTKIISTNVSAKEFLSEAETLDSQSSIKVSDLVIFNDEYVYAVDSSFESVFKGVLGPTNVSMMTYIEVEEDQEDGVKVDASEGGGGQSGSSGSSTEQEQGKKEIVNKGDAIVLKNGKKKVQLSGLDVKKINLMNGHYKIGSLEIFNITDGVFKNADLTFEILDKQLKTKVTFENGIPIFYIDTTIDLTLSEVKNGDKIVEENVEFFNMSETINKELVKTVRERMSQAVQIMRDNQVDLIDFYTIMYNSDKKSFLKFLDNLEDKEDYLSRMVFKVGVKIVSK